MEKAELQEDDLVLCTVDRIESNTIFVKLEDGKEATLIISEIAPGRIKNLREYVVPNKKIVCKVLRVQNNRIDLSLRRVASKERKDFIEALSYENNLKSAFNQILKDKSEEVIKKIKSNFISLKDFAEKSKLDNKILTKYFSSEYIELIEKIINKKSKEIEIKKTIKIKSLANDGVKKIKSLLKSEDSSLSITYLAAGLFLIKVKGEDYKQANQKLEPFLKDLESRAKKENCEFEILAN